MFRSYHCGKFISKTLKRLLENLDIEKQTSIPYNLQHNGVTRTCESYHCGDNKEHGSCSK